MHWLVQYVRLLRNMREIVTERISELNVNRLSDTMGIISKLI